MGASLPGSESRPVVPLFTADGSRLIASHEGGQTYVWDIRPSSLIRHACRVAGRQLTRAEWEAFLPGYEYAPAC